MQVMTYWIRCGAADVKILPEKVPRNSGLSRNLGIAVIQYFHYRYGNTALGKVPQTNVHLDHRRL